MNIYIDCSRTYIFGGNTGIQRVVRSIANNLPINGYNYKIRPVVISFGSYHEIGVLRMKSDRNLRILKKIKSILFGKHGSDDKVPMGKANSTTRGIVYSIFALPVIFRKRIHFEKGDVLIFSENFTVVAFSEIIKKIKDCGITIGFICFDLIPIRYPQYYPKEDTVNFETHLKKSLEYSQFCISISNHVKNDLSKYIVQIGLGTNIKLDSFRLGFTLDGVKYNGYIRPEIKVIFKKDISTYLIVSTIEPRKNHAYILDAFEEIWLHNPDVHLILIGKVGWMCNHVVERIKNHHQYNKRLFMFNDASDTELGFCYAKTKALINASSDEGFGLPIVESLSQKTPVLASDIPVFREVGSDFCSYFDLKNPSNLADIIIRWENTGQEPIHRNLNEFKWPTWKESTEELVNKIHSCIQDLSK